MAAVVNIGDNGREMGQSTVDGHGGATLRDGKWVKVAI